jgi:hypothetical protein
MSLQTWQETLMTSTAAGTSFGTFTTAKTVLPTGCLVTLPANWWYVGRMMRVTVWGGLGTLVTTPGTVTFQLNLGSVAALTSGAIQLNATAHANLPFRAECVVTCRSVGSGTAATLMGLWDVNGVMFTKTVGQVDQVNIGDSILAPAVAMVVGTGFDSTAAQTLDFFTGFSISNAANTVQVQQYLVEALN